MVQERSPPESWDSTIEPGLVFFRTTARMWFVIAGPFLYFCRFQSSGATSQPIDAIPRSLATDTAALVKLPPGWRKYLIGAAGTALWISSFVAWRSVRILSLPRVPSL